MQQKSFAEGFDAFGMGNTLVNSATVLREVPTFFTPNPDALRGTNAVLGVENAAYYSTEPLQDTLTELVNFAQMNDTRTTCLTVGAVNVNQYDQVIQAALEGQGVALGRLELIAPLLNSGRLVQLSPPQHRADSKHGYWLIRASESPRDDVRHVAQWIETEAHASADVAPL